MKFLVTGGAGFIGSHLTEHLLAAGHEVVVLDDLSTGREENLTGVAGSGRLAFVEGTVCDAGLVDRCVSGTDGVFHLAAAVGTFTILRRTLDSLRTNLHGTENVAAAAHRHGVPVLIASTSEVYGKNTKAGLTENDDRIVGSPLTNRWSYAEAKAIDETLAHAYAVELGLSMVIVRLFNTVGPRQAGRYGMVLPRFVAQALAGEPLTVYGTGRQVRCFCHVLDVVPALVALLADESARGQAFNLGSSERISIESLAGAVIAATGSASGITRIPYAEAYGDGFEDMQFRVPDCSRARRQVGFLPSRGLHQIITDVIADQRAGAERARSPGGGRGC